MKEQVKIVKEKLGFIAALDQSGGSSKKTLKLYGVDESQYQSEGEMFERIHDMRMRILKNPHFSGEKIIGVILFYQTMNKEVEGEYLANYLWKKKNIVSFLKIDKGLESQKGGVSLMKEITDLSDVLQEAKEKGIFGTKMRSVIYEANREGIKGLVEQQFYYAKEIIKAGLVPIIEPEVSIDSTSKQECEEIMKEEINKQLDKLEGKVMFKFTLPETDDFYKEYTTNPKVLRVVALSGGYEKKAACQKLAKNHQVIASFSRAFLEGLNIHQTKEEFSKVLEESMEEIYQASIT